MVLVLSCWLSLLEYISSVVVSCIICHAEKEFMEEISMDHICFDAKSACGNAIVAGAMANRGEKEFKWWDVGNVGGHCRIPH